METKQIRGSYPTWSDMLALLGVFVVMTVLCNVAFGLLVRLGSVSEGFGAFISYTVLFSTTILYALFIKRQRTGPGAKLLRFGMRKVNPAIVLWGLVMTVATSLVVEPLTNLMPDGMLELLSRQMGLGGWMMLTSIVLAPLLEEILFRGIIQDSLTDKLGPLRGILIGSAIFGIVHIIPQQVLNAFFVGLVLGYIYYKTGSLIPVILIHMINNAFSYFSWVLSGEKIIATKEMIGNDKLYYIVYGLACLIFIIALITMIRTLARDRVAAAAASSPEHGQEALPGKKEPEEGKLSAGSDNINRD